MAVQNRLNWFTSLERNKAVILNFSSLVIIFVAAFV